MHTQPVAHESSGTRADVEVKPFSPRQGTVEDHDFDGDRFFEFSREQLKAAEEDVDGIYTQSALLLAVMSALGGAVWALVDPRALPVIFVRLDAFIFYVSLTSASIMIFTATWHLAEGIQPRSDYQGLANVSAFLRKARRLRIQEDKVGDDRAGVCNDPLLDHILVRIAASECVYRERNEARRRRLGKTFRMVAWTAMAVLVAAVAKFLLLAQGVIPHAGT